MSLVVASPADPLGVRSTTLRVLQQARSVRIDDDRLAEVAAQLIATEPPAWDDTLHYRDPDPGEVGFLRTAMWILVLDTLNFCFWGQNPADPDDRWRVTFRGITHDGYDALAAALSRAVAEGHPLWDASWLATLPAATLRDILRPDAGSAEIPLAEARLAHLHELGAALQRVERDHPGQDPLQTLLDRADGSGIAFAREIIARMPSFNDIAWWDDTATGERHEVRFFKRAQILVADLAGALADRDAELFSDLPLLTAFADYKVPQVLRQLGVLVYADDLVGRIMRRERIPVNDCVELEIRAATIQACERIRAVASHENATPLTASQIDWMLWQAGQSLPKGSEPYHRTVTIFY